MSKKTIYQSLIRYYLNFICNHKYKFMSLFITASFWALSNSVSPYLIKIIVDHVVNFKGDPKDIYTVVLIPTALYIALRILLSIFVRIEAIIQVYTIPQVKNELRADAFSHTIDHSYEFFQSSISGSVSNQILNLANSFERIYTAIHSGIFPCLMSFAISATMMYKTVPSFAMFFIIWFFLSILVTSYLANKSIRLSNQRARAENYVSGYIVDTYRNIFTVLSFFHKDLELKQMAKVQDQELLASKKLEWEMIRIHAFRGIATTAMLSLMLVLLIEGWKRGLVTIGDFTFVSSSAFNMAHLTWYACKELVTLYKEWGIAKQAFSLLQAPYTNLDLPNAQDLNVMNGEIKFEQVSFHYPTGRNIFENQNVTIQAGQKVGLVGFSGSGKSTFVKLIMRFFEPQAGKILIDNQDIKNCTTKSIRKSIAVISQDPGLFNRSILENILYGKPSASYQEVVNATKKAHCEDFILQQAYGFDTILGEQGEGLSGGQQQRIAIARAALKDAPILILDEATSALDSITEQKIQLSIQAIMQNKTAIVIAHRLSTIMHLDRILVFDNGKIVEDGSHQELIAKNGHYAKLWNMQINGFIVDKESK